MLVHNQWETCPHWTTSIKDSQQKRRREKKRKKKYLVDSREYFHGKSNQFGKLCFSYYWCATQTTYWPRWIDIVNKVMNPLSQYARMTAVLFTIEYRCWQWYKELCLQWIWCGKFNQLDKYCFLYYWLTKNSNEPTICQILNLRTVCILYITDNNDDNKWW